MRAVRVMKFVRAFFADGGTERQLVDLAAAFDRSRVDVSFGCLRKAGQLAERVDALQLPVIDYRVESFRSPAFIAAQLRLARDIRRQGIDVVHTYGFASHLFAIPAAKLAGARVIASIRDMGIYLSPAKLRMQRVLCRFADRVLVNAGAIRDWLIESGYQADRISVVPNGICLSTEASSRHSIREELGLEMDAPLVGVVGRVTRLKGIEDFLTAAAMVPDRVPPVRFVVVGGSVDDNAYLGELRMLAARLGIARRVFFTGFRSDVARILGQLDVSVQPSLSEGLSNALLESMAAGAPVVATRVGGAGEVIEDGSNGLLVPAGDPQSMAAAISRLLTEPAAARRLGEAGRGTIAERYSMPRIADVTSHLYETLLVDRSRTAGDIPCPQLKF